MKLIKNKGNTDFAGLVATVALLAILGIIWLVFNSCTAQGQNTLKHMKSSFVGLNRHITLYANDGKVIREWDVDSKVEDRGGSSYFLNKEGKAITVSGTFVIEEK